MVSTDNNAGKRSASAVKMSKEGKRIELNCINLECHIRQMIHGMDGLILPFVLSAVTAMLGSETLLGIDERIR
jgi:hypothetical protein